MTGVALASVGLQSGCVLGIEALLRLSFLDQAGQERQIRTILKNPGSSSKIGADGSAECAEIWRKSILAKELEQLLSPSEDSFEASLVVFSPFSAPDDRNNQFNGELASCGDGEYLQGMLLNAQRVTSGAVDLSQLRLFDQVLVFVDSYFDQIHCWLPILERRDVLRVLHSEGLFESGDAALRSCLWAVIMLTLAQTSSDFEAGVNSQEILAVIYLLLCASSRTEAWGHLSYSLLFC